VPTNVNDLPKGYVNAAAEGSFTVRGENVYLATILMQRRSIAPAVVPLRPCTIVASFGLTVRSRSQSCKRSTRGGTLGKLSPARCPIKKNWLSCLVSNFSSCFWKKYGECHELPTRCRARACRLVFDRAAIAVRVRWRYPTLVTDSALGMEDSACIRFRTGLRRIVEQMAP
jgi:hypothetical protein